jgi:hypothetical protein
MLLTASICVAVSSGLTSQDETAWDPARAVAYLLGERREDGSWSGRTEKTEGPRSATSIAATCLAAMALLAYRDVQKEKAGAAVEEAVKFCFEQPEQNDFLSKVCFVWSQSYSLELAARLASHPDFKERGGAWREAAAKVLERVYAAQRRSGAWGYGRDGTSFQTAELLFALAEAKEAGFDVNEEAVGRGVAFLKTLRTDKGFLYAPGRAIRKTWETLEEGEALDRTSGRLSLCEGALFERRALKLEELESSLQRFMDHRSYLWEVRGHTGEPVKRQSWLVTEYGTPYANFVFYAYHRAARAVRWATREKAQIWARALSEDLLKHREENGAWAHLPGNCAEVSKVGVGNGVTATASALLTLRLLQDLKK